MFATASNVSSLPKICVYKDYELYCIPNKHCYLNTLYNKKLLLQKEASLIKRRNNCKKNFFLENFSIIAATAAGFCFVQKHKGNLHLLQTTNKHLIGSKNLHTSEGVMT